MCLGMALRPTESDENGSGDRLAKAGATLESIPRMCLA
jgi:hypothetical protein